MRYLLPLALLLLVSCSQTIYVVRHAEKETAIDMASMKPASDPPLSFDGQQRALKLKEILAGKGIKHIYSTNTIRTISTARPLKELYLGMEINLYSSKPDSMNTFIEKIKSIRKGNILIVGHSNTIDDIANKLAGKIVVPGDLKDNEYDNLYILRRKGSSYLFGGIKFGMPGN